MTEVSISNLTKSFGAVTVLEDLSLEIADGEFLSLLGPSGCGKTTTLRCVAGLEEPSGGRIRIGNDTVVDTARSLFVPPNKRGLGMVFQSYALWPHMTVFGNVSYPLRLQRRHRSEIRSKSEAALEMVGLSHLMNRRTSELSGGQQQRVAFARALAGEPRLVLLDEPLSNLDAALRGQMRRELRRIHKEAPRTSIYVTHDQLEAATLSDRIVIMHDGRIEQVGTPHEIFARPASQWVAGFVGFENFLTGKVLGREGANVMVQPAGWDAPLACVWSGDLPSPGAVATVAVRAGAFHSTHIGGGTPVRVNIVDRLFIGDETEYVLSVPGGTQLTCRMLPAGDPSAEPAIGATLTIHVSPGHAVALPGAPRDGQQAAVASAA